MTTYGVALRRQCNLFFCANQKAAAFFTMNLFSKGNHKNSPKESNLLPFGFTFILLGIQLSATAFLKMLYRAFENTPQRLLKCTVGAFKMFL
jgi:hypothetical protein